MSATPVNACKRRIQVPYRLYACARRVQTKTLSIHKQQRCTVNQRQLGNSDLQISEVGLGCWQLGGDFGPIEEKTVGAILETALDKQVNFFDTADVYGAGASERYLGERLSQNEPRPVIATKYGRGSETYPDKYSLSNLRD